MIARRGFLKRMAFAALATALFDRWVPGLDTEPLAAPPVGAVVLWGDGVHDDVVGIETLIGGGTVWDAQTGEWRTGARCYGETFACSRTIHFGPCENVIFTNNRLDFTIAGPAFLWPVIDGQV